MSSAAPAPALDGLETRRVDVEDPQYRATKEHAPDKKATWAHPQESDGWILSHNSIRAEIDKFEVVLTHLGERELKDWEQMALKVSVSESRSRSRSTARAMPPAAAGPMGAPLPTYPRAPWHWPSGSFRC